MRRALAILGAGLALGGCGLGGGDSGDEPGARERVVETTTTRVEVIEGAGREDGGFDPRLIYERDAPGVVTVISLFSEGGLEQLLDGEDDDGEGSGLGSGFVLNGKGEIATNAHVISTGQGTARRRARQVFVEFADGNRVEARVVGDDPNADIALLKIDPSGLQLRPLTLGSSGDVVVGTPVAAIGSPFGEEQSLSVGVVSAVDRDIESLTNFRISGAIQTDAAINPGNSGGPLVNAAGEVIGVNQQIRTSTGGSEGVGFAVPVDMVKRSIEMLRDDGRARYAYLGVSSNRIYPQLAEHFDLPVKSGAWVQEVTDGGPAERAGIRGGSGRQATFQAGRFCPGGDVITKVGDVAIEDSGDLADAIARYQPGRTVALEVYRDGKRRSVDVRLAERPARLADQSGGCS